MTQKPITFNSSPIDLAEELGNINVNLTMRWGRMGLEFGDITENATTIYAYEHGAIMVSLSPFSCSWDSGEAGIISGDKDYFKSAIRLINQFLNNDNFFTYDPEADLEFEGTQEECIEWANSQGYTAEFNY